MPTPFDRVRDALAQGGYQPRQVQGRTMARCPAHEDRSPSLSLMEGRDGRALLYCFAGCQVVDVVAALGLSMSDLFAESYEYRDKAGQVVRRVSRTYDAQGRKTFRQAGIVGGPTLYRLPEVVEAVAVGSPVYVVEGEKDADALAALGVTATTGPQGAGNFHLVDAEPLRGARVVAVVDRDAAGDKWAASVRDKLAGVGALVRFAAAMAGKDAADHVAAGYGVEDFQPYPDPQNPLAAGNPLSEVETLPEAESLSLADLMALDELRKLRARARARELFDAERRPPVEPFDLGTLAEVLARPAPPPDRIACLMPSEASTLIVAQRKTGKTTLTFNLARCLLTGEPFLGRFDVRPVAGTVALLNYEVSGHQAARWAAEAGVPADRFILVNLRGRRNPLSNPEDAARLAAELRAHRVESLIVDPFGRAYGGKNQNDAGEVGAWLVDLDRFARADVGALDLILTTHAGWNGERTRGASALEDWPDVILTMTKDETDTGNGDRYLRAIGRDVDLDEDRLDYDPDTRRLTLAGSGNRRQSAATRHLDELVPHVVRIATDQPGVNGTEVEARLKADEIPGQKGDGRKALAAAVDRGLLRMEPGKGPAKLYYPALPHNCPGDSSTTTPPPPYRGGVVEGAVPTTNYPEPRIDCPECDATRNHEHKAWCKRRFVAQVVTR